MTPGELKTARGKRTQVEFAQLMGVSAPSLRNWEQGVSPIPAYVPVIVSAIGPKPAKGWAIVGVDLRMSAAGHVATLPDHERATSYIAAHYPTAAIVTDYKALTVYAVITTAPTEQPWARA